MQSALGNRILGRFQQWTSEKPITNRRSGPSELTLSVALRMTNVEKALQNPEASPNSNVRPTCHQIRVSPLLATRPGLFVTPELLPLTLANAVIPALRHESAESLPTEITNENQ